MLIWYTYIRIYREFIVIEQHMHRAVQKHPVLNRVYGSGGFFIWWNCYATAKIIVFPII